MLLPVESENVCVDTNDPEYCKCLKTLTHLLVELVLNQSEPPVPTLPQYCHSEQPVHLDDEELVDDD